MMTVLAYSRWTAVPALHAAAAAIARAMTTTRGVPPALAQVLVNRGESSVAAVDRLTRAPTLAAIGDPTSVPGVDQAVERLTLAVRAEERVLVWGDADADGVCATAIMARTLLRLGARVTAHIPERDVDGRDLNRQALDRATAIGATLIVAVDCGIRQVEAADAARARGIDVIIVDHHEPGPTLPRVDAIVHPSGGLRPVADVAPGENACAAALTFRLAWALYRAMEIPVTGNRDLRGYLELATIATLADRSPLEGANRAIVRAGLAGLRRPQFAGVEAIWSGAAHSPRWGRSGGARGASAESARRGGGATRAADGAQAGMGANEDDVISTLIPVLNAACKMGKGDIALALLMTDDAVRAKAVAAGAARARERRADETRRVLRQARARLDGAPEDPVIVLYDERWHPGVLGAVASRLAEQYGRPAIILSAGRCTAPAPGATVDGDPGAAVPCEAETEVSGSVRGAPGACGALSDLAELVRVAGDGLVTRTGGHKGACGLSLPASRVTEFAARLVALAEQRIDEAANDADDGLHGDEDDTAHFRPEAPLTVGEAADVALLQWIDRLGPFGAGNPEPTFLIDGAVLRTVGVSRGDQNQLCGELAQDGVVLPFRARGMAEQYPPAYVSGRPVRAVVVLERGHRTGGPQLRVLDLRIL